MNAMRVIYLLISCSIFLPTLIYSTEDFYQLLGITKSATQRDIRRAFKRIALEKHPDKRTGDPNAHAEFLQINRAYEILRDDELRKKYDTYGEEGLKDDFNRGNQYQSWNFYQHNFGIYDEDPEIITLSRTDFLQSVDGSQDVWFINYYSPQCSHCHELAPAWREISKILEGVIRIGAVNCQDEWMMCNEQGIRAYPTLRIYPKRDIYQGPREKNALIRYAMSFVSAHVVKFDDRMFKTLKADTNKPWLVSFCRDIDEGDCLDDDQVFKLAVMLNNLVQVASVNCHADPHVCEQLKPQSTILFYPTKDFPSNNGYSITSLNLKDIVSQILALLPNLSLITKDRFRELIKHLKESADTKPWLIQFVDEINNDKDHELKKLPSMLNDYNVGRFDCSSSADTCTKLYIFKKPAFILFKQGGHYEFYYGRHTSNDIAGFVRDNAFSPLRALTPSDFPSVTTDSKPFIIDFFSPFCPPCMHLLPEFRKASKRLTDKLLKGIAHVAQVDCTVQSQLCQKQGVYSYPTIRLYPPNADGHTYIVYNNGWRDVNSLRSWAFQNLPSKVVEVDGKNFSTNILRDSKPWLIDFYAPWCGHCHQFSPIFEGVARRLDGKVNLGKINCDNHRQICERVSIHAYPTIKYYKGSIDFKRQEFLGDEIGNLDEDFIVNYINDQLQQQQQQQASNVHHTTEL
ncbi:unnamed protein product [Rotaria magnacalcarata]|uniref:DnaJ homolog subfamily C member 10 n=1 Tax=Rotaria magnacalcarata TaxID=392030 RepID=A0A8S2MRF2_9BILA|nr:unnamed protein product [Rotaria magnacalcarata]